MSFSSVASLGSTVANGVVGLGTTLCSGAKCAVLCSGRTFVNYVHVPTGNLITNVFARANALTGVAPYAGILAAVSTTVALGVLANRLWQHRRDADASPIAMAFIRAAGVVFAAAAGSAAAATFMATAGGPVALSYAIGLMVAMPCFFAYSTPPGVNANATANANAKGSTTPSRSASASATSLSSSSSSSSVPQPQPLRSTSSSSSVVPPVSTAAAAATSVAPTSTASGTKTAGSV